MKTRLQRSQVDVEILMSPSFETLIDNVCDAHSEDLSEPFGPRYEIVGLTVEMHLMANKSDFEHIRRCCVISQDGNGHPWYDYSKPQSK
jgi:hypothetical protein